MYKSVALSLLIFLGSVSTAGAEYKIGKYELDFTSVVSCNSAQIVSCSSSKVTRSKLTVGDVENMRKEIKTLQNDNAKLLRKTEELDREIKALKNKIK